MPSRRKRWPFRFVTVSVSPRTSMFMMAWEAASPETVSKFVRGGRSGRVSSKAAATTTPSTRPVHPASLRTAGRARFDFGPERATSDPVDEPTSEVVGALGDSVSLMSRYSTQRTRMSSTKSMKHRLYGRILERKWAGRDSRHLGAQKDCAPQAGASPLPAMEGAEAPPALMPFGPCAAGLRSGRLRRSAHWQHGSSDHAGRAK